MTKVTYRIPSKDPYGYVEFETDVADPNFHNLIEVLEEMMDFHKTGDGPGLSEKEFNQVLDQYLKDGTITSDGYAACNPEQQKILQAIKKSLKRINYASNTDVS